jgi:hypothetical protein
VNLPELSDAAQRDRCRKDIDRIVEQAQSRAGQLEAAAGARM